MYLGADHTLLLKFALSQLKESKTSIIYENMSFTDYELELINEMLKEVIFADKLELKVSH